MTGYRGYQKFFADLKRRQVFKVAAVYGAVAFAVIEGTDLIFDAFAVPHWAFTVVTSVILLGFPVALILAWALEQTPEGIRRTDPALSGELEAIVAQPPSKRWVAGLAALVGTVLLVGAGWLALNSDDSYGSIAVLPFVNMSADPDNEYFSDGLAEELLNALAGIAELKVAARTSAFAFKGRNADVREIGRLLDVETVLEGSVRKDGDRVRITAQLIDASDGYHIWSHEYDRRLDDIFALQEELAGSIVDALAVSLGVAEVRGLYLGGTSDVEAYEFYLWGRQRWATRRVPDLHLAVSDFEAAIARDSTFALAWSGLADAIDALAWREPESQALVPRGLAAARRSIAIEPQLAEGHASLGILLAEFERDYAQAEESLRRAVELKPGYAPARHFLGAMLRNAGHMAEALEQHREAARLDPLSGIIQNDYAGTLAAARLWREAAQQTERAINVPQPDPAAYFLRVTKGRRFGLSADQLADAAETWARMWGIDDPERWRVVGAGIVDSTLRPAGLEELGRRSTGVDRGEWYRYHALAELWLAYGEHERALDHLERAFEADDPTLGTVGIDPAWDPLRQDPRFLHIIEALGLPNGYFPDRGAGAR